MSGDPMCPECGGDMWLCSFHGSCKYGDTNMSMRPKTERYSLGPIPVSSTQMGEAMDSDTLKKILTGYMGDEFFAEKFLECIDLIKVKNADYSQGEQKGDRIAAFRRIQKDYDIPMRKVWAIFAEKHWGAVRKFIKDGRVESEPIEGRIKDVINYMILLAAIIADGERPEVRHGQKEGE